MGWHLLIAYSLFYLWVLYFQHCRFLSSSPPPPPFSSFGTFWYSFIFCTCFVLYINIVGYISPSIGWLYPPPAMHTHTHTFEEWGCVTQEIWSSRSEERPWDVNSEKCSPDESVLWTDLCPLLIPLLKPQPLRWLDLERAFREVIKILRVGP